MHDVQAPAAEGSGMRFRKNLRSAEDLAKVQIRSVEEPVAGVVLKVCGSRSIFSAPLAPV